MFECYESGPMDHFWSKVSKGPGDGCWTWTACRTPLGYGKFAVRRRVQAAHRVAWELSYGAIQHGLFVLHRCDNPSCVRPDHLFLGSAKDNTQDMMRKGRHRGGKRGVANTQAKLSWDQVRAIRAKYATTRHLSQKDPGRITMDDLVAEFGISHTAIHSIVNHVSWRETA